MTLSDDPNLKPKSDPVTDPKLSEEAVRRARHDAWVQDMLNYDWSLESLMVALGSRRDEIVAKWGATTEELQFDSPSAPAGDAGEAGPPGAIQDEPTDDDQLPPSDG